MKIFPIYLIAVVALVEQTFGHGMLMDPPNRSSMWRFFPGYPENYDDDGNYCGGMTVR